MEEKQYSSWKLIKRLLTYYSKEKYLLLFSCLLIVLATITEISSPIILSNFIKNILHCHNIKTKKTLYFIIYFVVLQSLSSLFYYLYTIVFSSLSAKIIKTIRIEMMEIALRQPMKIFDQQPINSIITKITNDTESVQEFYETIISSFLKSIILFSMILAAMLMLEWHMALLSASITPFLLIIVITHQRYSKPVIKQIKKYISRMNNTVHEIINGIVVIQQFNQEKNFLKKIEKINNHNYLNKMRILKIDALLLRPLLTLISTIILSSIIVILKIFPMKNLEISVLHTFINYIRYLNEPLVAITNQQTILQQVLVSSVRIFKFIDSPIDTYGYNSVPLKTGKITFHNVSFSYPNTDKVILKNININIPDKSYIALVGKTGSGKTTLSNLILKYYTATQGEILLDGKPIDTFANSVLRKHISIVQQEPTILYDNLIKNISLGRNIKQKKIIKALHQSQLKKLVNSLPEGYMSVLGKKGNNLSQGQKQMIGIARILVSQPKILIFDEATASIDSESEQKIQKILSSIKRKSTIIVIAHRLSTIVKADTIVVLDKGKIIEMGSHDQLIKNKKLYYKMYTHQNNYTDI
ncbi:ABC transporter transmembrane domain-containing protein [Buchnera aphidicola]|uniref:ABC transporter transmembrane domain-containing protein n=1 Tax=Buchnera aphidicola TaxID=9 RepID=UPI00094DBD54|nr:ABC transporter transmembrane domain-containing protein [Buchnera aphidicola]